jgi:hypothetical protein
MKVSIHMLFRWVLLFSILLINASIGYALTDPDNALNLHQPVHLHAKAIKPAALLSKVSTEYKLGIAVDGHLPATSIDFDFDGELTGALDRIAEQMDCRWRISKAGTLLFNQAFKNPQSVPQMHVS